LRSCAIAGMHLMPGKRSCYKLVLVRDDEGALKACPERSRRVIDVRRKRCVDEENVA
jgi:hypothetical protein